MGEIGLGAVDHVGRNVIAIGIFTVAGPGECNLHAGAFDIGFEVGDSSRADIVVDDHDICGGTLVASGIPAGKGEAIGS